MDLTRVRRPAGRAADDDAGDDRRAHRRPAPGLQSVVRGLVGVPEPAEGAEVLTPPRSGAPTGGASRRRPGAGLELPAGLSEAELVAPARRLKVAPVVESPPASTTSRSGRRSTATVVRNCAAAPWVCAVWGTEQTLRQAEPCCMSPIREALTAAPGSPGAALVPTLPTGRDPGPALRIRGFWSLVFSCHARLTVT